MTPHVFVSAGLQVSKQREATEGGVGACAATPEGSPEAWCPLQDTSWPGGWDHPHQELWGQEWDPHLPSPWGQEWGRPSGRVNQWWLKMFVQSLPHKQSSFESVGFNSVPGPLRLTGYSTITLCLFSLVSHKQGYIEGHVFSKSPSVVWYQDKYVPWSYIRSLCPTQWGGYWFALQANQTFYNQGSLLNSLYEVYHKIDQGLK